MIKLVNEEANTKKKVREGVEFKLKKINGLVNADVAEFMKKWDNSKNKTIFDQARKRGAGRIAGKKKTEERAKSKGENNFNTSAAINQLNMAPAKNRLMKKAKDEVARFAGRIGKWDSAIKNAKSNNTLTNLEKQLNKKIELRTEIKVSKIGPIKKRGHLEKVMQLNNNVGQRRKIFEQQLNDVAQNAKKKELSKYITGLNIPAENKSRYVKQTNKPGANLDMIRRSANKQVEEKVASVSKSLVANAIGRVKNKSYANAKKIGGTERKNPLFNNGEISATALTPNVVKPSFKSLVQKNKQQKVMNAVKSAAKIAENKKKLESATGANRVQLARKQQANMNRNKGLKASTAASLLSNKAAVRKAAEKAAISAKEKLRRNAAAQPVVSRTERRQQVGGNLNILKDMKKRVKKENPKLSPKQINAEARKRVAKMKK